MGEWDDPVPEAVSACATQAPSGGELSQGKPRARKPARSSPRADAPGAQRRSAAELAKQARDISVSEFFAKNRHLLGFDNPSKALLTTVKEGVDNSLDACEEAGILPDVRVEIGQISETRFRIAIQDNGPGILRKQVPKISGVRSTAPSSTA
jgi:DNA topoisomerase-6 subunit B